MQANVSKVSVIMKLIYFPFFGAQKKPFFLRKLFSIAWKRYSENYPLFAVGHRTLHGLFAYNLTNMIIIIYFKIPFGR